MPEHELVGLYLDVYWYSLELGDSILAEKDGYLAAIDIEKQRDCDQWLESVSPLLPEWATEFLAHYDSLLEMDAL